MALRLAVDHEITETTDVFTEAISTAEGFHVDVAREPGSIRVSPVGEVDVATVEQVAECLGEAFADGAAQLVLDLRATTFLDSTGLHMALRTHERATAAGVGFALIAGPPAVQRTFEVTGLTQHLPFVDVPHG
jgi:anti-anti-sigma factor